MALVGVHAFAANSAPTITAQPVNQVVAPGNSGIFTTAASGVPAPTFQWQIQLPGSATWFDAAENAGNFTGTHTNTLTVINLGFPESGRRYRVVATNSEGSVASSGATLTLRSNGTTAVVKLAAARDHSVRLDGYYGAFVTGNNSLGQLGTGDATSLVTPANLTIADRFIADISTWSQHTLFLTSSFEVWGTGLNDHGQLGTGGNKFSPVQLSTNAAGIGTGLMHSAVLKADGTLWTMGGNDQGQLGNGTTTDINTWVQIASGVADLAVGTRQTLFLKSDGTLWGVGNLDGTSARALTPVQISSNVAKIAAGGSHSLFVKTDGTLWALGSNAHGQLGIGNTTTMSTPVQVTTGVKSVAAGYSHSFFVKTDGTLWGMGYNSSGQLGDATTSDRPSPVQVATDVTTVSASLDYTIFIKAGGSLWAMGSNASGQFGNGGTTSSITPVQLASKPLPLPASCGIVPTTNASTSRVHLIWGPIAGASSYEVWRSTSNNFSAATRIAQGLHCSLFDDLTGTIEVSYYYWVRAVNNAGSINISPFGVFGLYTAAIVAPAVTTAPVNQSVTAGGSASFTVSASGTPQLYYFWQRLPAGSGTWNYVNEGNGFTGAATPTLAITGAALGMNGDQYRVIINSASGAATSSAATLTVTASVPPAPKIWTDLNGDGKADLLWRNTSSNEYAGWLMNGTAMASSASYGLPAEWRVIKAADFDGDGKSDLVWRNTTTGAVVLWQMNGTTIGASTWLYDSGTDWTAEIFADFNGDGKTDILWHNTVNGQYAIWLMNGGTVASAGGFSIAAGWSVAKAADFNGDGKTDLLWRNATTGGVVMWLQNGTTTASATWIYDSGTDWAFQLFADFNGDGKTDILWHNTVTGQYAFWLMDGSTVAGSSGFSIAAGWQVTHAADFNGDGKADLIWRNSTSGGMVMWLQDGATTTSTAWIYDSGTDWEIAATKDFNGDGKADLLWHNTVSGLYAFWLMNGATTASAAGFSLPAGWVLDQ